MSPFRILSGVGTAGVAAAILMGAGRPSAHVALKISGAATLTYDKQEAIAVPAGDGHQLMVGEVKGINKNTASSDFFADADVTNIENG